MKIIDAGTTKGGQTYTILKYDLNDAINHNYLLLQLQEIVFDDQDYFANGTYTDFCDQMEQGNIDNLLVAQVKDANGTSHLAGFIYDYKDDRPNNYMLRGSKYIEMLGVHPNYRRMGLGTKLLNSMFDCLAREDSKAFVRLSVAYGNRSAQQLYHSIGFKMYSIDGYIDRMSNQRDIDNCKINAVIQLNENAQIFGDLCYVALMKLGDNATQSQVRKWFNKVATSKSVNRSFEVLPTARLNKVMGDKYKDLFMAVRDCMVEYYGIRQLNKNKPLPFEKYVINRVNEYQINKNMGNNIGAVLVSGNEYKSAKDNHTSELVDILKCAMLTVRDKVSSNANHPLVSHVVTEIEQRPYVQFNPELQDM